MATTSGYFVNKTVSTVSSPAVCYSGAYTITRADENTATVSATLTFSGWLNSSSSKLGTGIKLTVYARFPSGAWKSCVLKSTSSSWSGTTKHSASLTLTGSVKSSKSTIEFYVTRSGSTYGGNAGVFGSAKNPKSYSASFPAYSDSSSSSTSGGVAYIKVNGAWKQAVPYVKVNGVWKQAVPYVKVNGAWKTT